MSDEEARALITQHLSEEQKRSVLGLYGIYRVRGLSPEDAAKKTMEEAIKEARE